MFIPSKKVHNEYGDFDSETEWLVFEQIILPMLNDGVIDELSLHESFEIIPRLTVLVPKVLKTKIKYVERVLEQNAEYTCDFLYHDRRDDTMHIVEVKSNYSARARDYPLRRKLIRRLIVEWNAKEGWERYKFDEYKETDIVKEKKPKRVRKVKSKKQKQHGKEK